MPKCRSMGTLSSEGICSLFASFIGVIFEKKEFAPSEAFFFSSRVGKKTRKAQKLYSFVKMA